MRRRGEAGQAQAQETPVHAGERWTLSYSISPALPTTVPIGAIEQSYAAGLSNVASVERVELAPSRDLARITLRFVADSALLVGAAPNEYFGYRVQLVRAEPARELGAELGALEGPAWWQWAFVAVAGAIVGGAVVYALQEPPRRPAYAR